MFCNGAIAAVIIKFYIPFFGAGIKNIKTYIVAGMFIFLANITQSRYQKRVQRYFLAAGFSSFLAAAGAAAPAAVPPEAGAAGAAAPAAGVAAAAVAPAAGAAASASRTVLTVTTAALAGSRNFSLSFFSSFIKIDSPNSRCAT